MWNGITGLNKDKQASLTTGFIFFNKLTYAVNLYEWDILGAFTNFYDNGTSVSSVLPSKLSSEKDLNKSWEFTDLPTKPTGRSWVQ